MSERVIPINRWLTEDVHINNEEDVSKLVLDKQTRNLVKGAMLDSVSGSITIIKDTVKRGDEVELVGNYGMNCRGRSSRYDGIILFRATESYLKNQLGKSAVRRVQQVVNDNWEKRGFLQEVFAGG